MTATGPTLMASSRMRLATRVSICALHSRWHTADSPGPVEPEDLAVVDCGLPAR